MKENEIFNKLRSFIEKERGKYSFKLMEYTRVEQDLKITGDDATEFMISYGKEFKVDVSNFMADEYFYSESSYLLNSILGRFFKRDKKTLTLKNLLLGIKAGKLDEDIINTPYD